MQVLSVYRGAKISAFKAREVTRAIQGLKVEDAINLLRWTPKKAARLVGKTLLSAVANAENNNNLRSEKLVVKEAVVGEGPTMRRFTPKARGSAGPIRKRTSHIRVIVTDEIEIAEKEVRKPKRTGAKAKAPRKAAPAAEHVHTAEGDHDEKAEANAAAAAVASDPVEAKQEESPAAALEVQEPAAEAKEEAPPTEPEKSK